MVKTIIPCKTTYYIKQGKTTNNHFSYSQAYTSTTSGTATFTSIWTDWKARIERALKDGYHLRDEDEGDDQARRGIVVLKGSQVVMFILICQRGMGKANLDDSNNEREEEAAETLVSQWVGAHFRLEKGSMGVLCCYNSKYQLLEVDIPTACKATDGMALISSCFPQNKTTFVSGGHDKDLEAAIIHGISFYSGSC